ncbi:DNA replication complex GINS protein PSF1 isoform X1 [Punica granatum]|uniref:DNA replication complex GINS protein PSF1 isoform X1 n=3 Tax=Punica granatum TaxID=22663 RepID=A0A6P8D8D2_PUNGR|nr:DNA replication complex GINS protein PSF1 isoform X1 [Punica granatum]
MSPTDFGINPTANERQRHFIFFSSPNLVSLWVDRIFNSQSLAVSELSLKGKSGLGDKTTALKLEIFVPPFVIKDMYGRKACQLVKEFATSEKEQLKTFNDDLFDQVIKECGSHNLGFQSLVRKMQDEGLDTQTARNGDFYGALIHHLSLVRNKRCLMAYMYNRAEVIRGLRWKLGRVLPEEIVKKLSNSEKDYLKGYSGALETYMNDMNLELTVDMVPPKDPYIKVRVLEDIGEVLLTDKSANLARHSMHFLKRTDAEPYISQGLMEELLS